MQLLRLVLLLLQQKAPDMKKYLAVALLAISLGGCAQLQAIQSAIQIGTATAANPVTPDRLFQMENAAQLIFVGLNTWKTSCKNGILPVSCKTQIAAVQVYTRQIPPYLAQLRSFVKKNDQINAQVVFNQITSLISIVKTQAAQSNVPLGS